MTWAEQKVSPFLLTTTATESPIKPSSGARPANVSEPDSGRLRFTDMGQLGVQCCLNPKIVKELEAALRLGPLLYWTIDF